MKKTFLLPVLAIIIAVGGIGYLFTKNTSADTVTNVSVAATIPPIYDLVEQIGGDEINTTLILPPGTSPHTFDPTPSTLRDVQDSKVIFAIGHGLDDWAAELVQDSTNIKIALLDKGINLRESTSTHSHDEDEHADDHHEDEHADDHHEDEHADDHGHSHGPIDPHYWLDPRNALIMINTITEELSAIDPTNAEQFTQRANALKADINEKIAEWENEFKSIEGASFMTLHDAFYYLADFGNLSVAATFEPFPGKSPTPQYLAELANIIRDENITVLFSEPQLATDALDPFASDNNISLGVLDPLGGIENRVGYIQLIEYNVNTLVQTLQ